MEDVDSYTVEFSVASFKLEENRYTIEEKIKNDRGIG
jgi:hypothetical protein